jgi:predicted RNase H-like nuclease (RuvC/YqgF family)
VLKTVLAGENILAPSLVRELPAKFTVISFTLFRRTVFNSKFKIQNSKFKTQNSKFKTQNSKFKTQNSKLKTQNSKLKIQNSKLKTQNSKLKTQNNSPHDKPFSMMVDRPDTTSNSIVWEIALQIT